MRVVAIANQKGGCGKTTTAVNLGASLGSLGQRALLVDLDPQSHATVALTDPRGMGGPGVAEVLGGKTLPGGAIVTVADGLDLLGSSPRLDELESAWSARPGTTPAVKRALAGVAERYDFALLDCPPNTGPLTRAALAASDYLLLPVETSYFALYGVGRMLRLVEGEAGRRGEPVPYGVLLTLFDRRTAHAREVLMQLRGHFGKNLLDTVIGIDVRLREAASHGRPITAYRPRSRGAQRHLQLARELTARLASKAGRKAAAGGS